MHEVSGQRLRAGAITHFLFLARNEGYIQTNKDQWICISEFDQRYAYGPLCGKFEQDRSWLDQINGLEQRRGCNFMASSDDKTIDECYFT